MKCPPIVPVQGAVGELCFLVPQEVPVRRRSNGRRKRIAATKKETCVEGGVKY